MFCYRRINSQIPSSPFGRASPLLVGEDIDWSTFDSKMLVWNCSSVFSHNASTPQRKRDTQRRIDIQFSSKARDCNNVSNVLGNFKKISRNALWTTCRYPSLVQVEKLHLRRHREGRLGVECKRRQTQAGIESPALDLFEFQEKTRALGGSTSPNIGSTIQSHYSVLKKTARIIRFNASTTPSSTTKDSHNHVEEGKRINATYKQPWSQDGAVRPETGLHLGNREMFVRFLTGIWDFSLYQGCRR